MRSPAKGGFVALALLAPAVATLASLSAGAAAAASCREMTVSYSVSGSTLVVLTPNRLDVAYGGCVQFTNQTAATATITVGGHYSQQVAPNSSTSGSHNFVGTTPGRLSVTATSGPGTAHGSITVGPRSSPAPSPSPSPSQNLTPTPSLAPTPTQSSSGSTGPQVAPSPHHHKHSPGPGGSIEPPVSPAGPIQLPPSVTPSPAATGIAAGPVEPPSGRGKGLPAAIAAVAVVGTGAALIRVVAAEPVDGRRIVGGSS